MKEQFLKIAAAILVLTGMNAPGFATETTSAPIVQVAKQAWIMGNVWFEEVRAEYERGDYADFLQKIDTRYKQGIQKDEWQKLFNEERKWADNEDAETVKKQAKAYGIEFDALRHNRNEQLKALAARHQGEMVANIIHSLNGLTDEEKSALAFLKNIDSNTTIQEVETTTTKQIITEYRVKRLILTLAIAGHDEWAGDIQFDKESVAKYRVALELEKYSKLKTLANEHPDTVCTKNIEIAAAAYPKIAAEIHDKSFLIELENGSRAPGSEAETQLSEILKDSFGKQRALAEKYGLN